MLIFISILKHKACIELYGFPELFLKECYVLKSVSIITEKSGRKYKDNVIPTPSSSLKLYDPT